MAEQDYIGIGLLVSAILLLAILFRFKTIRQNLFFVVVFSLNPGLVGVLAASAFLFRDNPTIAKPCWVATLVLSVLTTFVVAFALPRMFMQQLKEYFAESDGDAPEADQGEKQG